MALTKSNPQFSTKPCPTCKFCNKLGHSASSRSISWVSSKPKATLPLPPLQVDPSPPPLDTPAYTLWNADTVASSHMTPHHHWLRNYKLCCIEVKLADGSSIYSEGIDSVLFKPVINGSPAQQVEFTNVLHVPALRSNLFSVLFSLCIGTFWSTSKSYVLKDNITLSRQLLSYSPANPLEIAPLRSAPDTYFLYYCNTLNAIIFEFLYHKFHQLCKFSWSEIEFSTLGKNSYM